MKKLKIFLPLMLVLIFFSPKKLLAYDEVSKAFADFIELLYLNTQTINKASNICLYGSDDISSYLLSKNKAITIGGGGKAVESTKACRIVYFAKNEEKYIKSFVDVLNKTEAVTLATFESFVNDGGMVFVDLGRRDFELTINSSVFKASGAKFDSSITALIINTKYRQ